MDNGVHDVASGVMLRVEELVGRTLLDFVGFADRKNFAFDRAGDGHLGTG